MSTVNPIPISPLDTHDPYYLPSTSRMNGLDWQGRDDEDDEEPRRGRDTSPRPLPNLHSRSVSPARNPNPFEFTRRKSSSTIHSAIIQAHHTLPSISTYSRSRSQASLADGAGDGNALIPLDPVLYLPPLLSPLPTSIRHGGQGQRIKTTSHADLEFATRLPDIDPASLALHQTLHNFRPLDETYSITDYDQAFNWADIVCPSPLPFSEQHADEVRRTYLKMSNVNGIASSLDHDVIKNHHLYHYIKQIAKHTKRPSRTVD
jgi:hypothetical protein